MSIIIRDLQTYEEFTHVQALHRTIWGLDEGLYPPMLNTVAQNGGVVLGAFDNEKMIGFSFAFLGRHHDGTLKLCSQTTGLLPDYRGQKLGEQIKWAQYDRALTANIRLITWTVDPLEALNANLNFRKLGGICRAYYENLYGENFSDFGKGMPSDRFLVEWWLDQGRVPRLRRGEATVPLSPTSPVANPTQRKGLSRQITSLDLSIDTSSLTLEIPANIQKLRQTNLSLAIDWRLQTRQAIVHYLSRGYIIEDFFTSWKDDEQRVFYVLNK
jgi:predicted GNAT superfamily acetyltransferase